MSDSSKSNVDQLLAALAGKDVVERQKARNSLVEIGAAAVPGLLTALDANQQHVRWEAAKTLTEIADPTAADALVGDPKILILDEPTMGLSLKETRRLLDFVRSIKAAGKSAIFIDHNVFHVYSVADRVVVLDRGMVAGEFMTEDITLDELMNKMYQVAQTGHMD